MGRSRGTAGSCCALASGLLSQDCVCGCKSWRSCTFQVSFDPVVMVGWARGFPASSRDWKQMGWGDWRQCARIHFALFYFSCVKLVVCPWCGCLRRKTWFCSAFLLCSYIFQLFICPFSPASALIYNSDLLSPSQLTFLYFLSSEFHSRCFPL